MGRADASRLRANWWLRTIPNDSTEVSDVSTTVVISIRMKREATEKATGQRILVPLFPASRSRLDGRAVEHRGKRNVKTRTRKAGACGTQCISALGLWPSFFGTAHTQRALVGVEREFLAVEHPSFVEIEARRIPRRMPAIIH